MALTINYDGFGVVANADSLTTDTGGGSWAELGGGTISDNPDVYLYGSQSIGSKYASKTGYTYFTADTALNFTTTEAGQYLYFWVNIAAAGAFDVIANLPFNIVIGSSTGAAYEYTIAAGDDANGWTGGWKLFVIDIANTTPTIDNTPTLSAINTLGVWIDTAASVRADSIWNSQIMCAKGLNIEGTPTTSGAGFDEIVTWATDYTNRAAGMFQKRGGTYFALGQITIGSTAQTAVTSFTSTGDSVEYEASEFWNGTAWVTSMSASINKIILAESGSFATTATFQDTGISGYVDNKLTIDSTGGSGFFYTGGYLKQVGVWTLTSTDTFDGVVISDSNGIKTGGAAFDGCTVNNTLAPTSSGALEIVNATDITSVTNIAFNNYTGKYAVYIPASVTGTVSFDNWVFDGSGTDVYWAGTSGTLTVALTNGSNATTYSSGGGTVAFENSVALSITNLRANTEVRIYKASDNSILSGVEDVTETDWLDTSVTPNVQYYKHTYSFNAGVLGGTDVYIMIFNKDYQDIRLNYTLLSSNASLLIQQIFDRVKI